MGFWPKRVHSARWGVPGARFLLEPLIFVRIFSSLKLTGFRTLRTYVCRKIKLFTGENRFRFSKSHTYTGALYKIKKNIYTGVWDKSIDTYTGAWYKTADIYKGRFVQNGKKPGIVSYIRPTIPL